MSAAIPASASVGVHSRRNYCKFTSTPLSHLPFDGPRPLPFCSPDRTDKLPTESPAAVGLPIRKNVRTTKILL